MVHRWDPTTDGVIHPVIINSAFSILSSNSSSAGGGGHDSKAEPSPYQHCSERGPHKVEKD